MPTGLLPLSEISSVKVVMDVEETEWDMLKEDILAWGRAAGVKVGIYFFDFRKLGKNELLLTSIQTTVARKELNWIGMPPLEKVSGVIDTPCDLFISLVDSCDFPVDFVSKCAAARFKIGRYPFDGHVFDMIIVGNPTEDLRSDARRIFAAMTEFIKRIM